MTSTSKCSIRRRTCIATGRKLPDRELLRVVADGTVPGVVLADPTRSLPGRGAWITPTWDALKLAEERRAFSRALRLSAPADVGHVHKYLADKAKDPTEVRKTEH